MRIKIQTAANTQHENFAKNIFRLVSTLMFLLVLLFSYFKHLKKL